MATFGEMFGTGATVNTSNASDPILQISFSGLASTGWDDPAGATDPEKWWTALIKFLAARTIADTADVDNVTAELSTFKDFVQRNELSKIQFSYAIAIFEPDTTAPAPDPDNV